MVAIIWVEILFILITVKIEKESNKAHFIEHCVIFVKTKWYTFLQQKKTQGLFVLLFYYVLCITRIETSWKVIWWPNKTLNHYKLLLCLISTLIYKKEKYFVTLLSLESKTYFGVCWHCSNIDISSAVTITIAQNWFNLILIVFSYAIDLMTQFVNIVLVFVYDFFLRCWK